MEKTRSSLLVVVAALLCIMMVTSCSSMNGTKGLEYHLWSDGTYAVTVGDADYVDQIVIPSKYDGKPVGHIPAEAFKNCTILIGVTIPASVTSIEKGAFLSCRNLQSVVFDGRSQLKNIGDSAFADCNLKSITIPDGVTSIGDYAFKGSEGFTITIPASVMSIGEYAFVYCSNFIVNYGGTKEQWNKIQQDDEDLLWDHFSGEYTIYCSDGILESN